MGEQKRIQCLGMLGDRGINMKKVLLRGPILTQSGYGEHARFLWRSLKKFPQHYEVYVEPLTWGQTSWMWEDTEERQQIDEDIAKCMVYRRNQGHFDVAFLVTIPNEWERIAPVTIGVTAGIETTKVSPQWLYKANTTVDKIIVPSTFSKEVFEKTRYPVQDEKTSQNTVLKLAVPIEVVHYPVKEFSEVELGVELESDFNFLCVAQWGPRKNINNTIKWFLKEFKDDDVGLVLKTSKARNCVIDRMLIQKEIREVIEEMDIKDRKCKIYLLHGYMNNDEIHSLYVHPKIKAIVNFGHGEGFGLPLFEAAYCEMPVITHEFGGQKDFLFAPKNNKKGGEKLRPFFSNVVYETRPVHKEAVWDTVVQADSEWAYVNEQGAKMAMREAYENYSLHKGKAKKLKKWILNNFKSDEQHKQMVESAGIHQEIDEEIETLFNELEL